MAFGALTARFRYEEAKGKGVDNYDRDLEDVIDRLIVECDRKIARALKRLEEDDAKAAIAISVSEVTQVCFNLPIGILGFLHVLEEVNIMVSIKMQTPEILELSKQIKEKLNEADQHG